MLIQLKKTILFLGDLIFLHLALGLIILIRYPQTELLSRLAGHWPNFLIIFGIWLLLFYINDLYNLNLRATSRQFFRQTFNAATLSSLISILYFYLNVKAEISPKTNLALFIIVFLGLFIIWRRLYQALDHSWIPKNNLALVGFNSAGQEILKELRRHPGAGYQIELIFKNPAELDSLTENIKAKNIKVIVVSDDFGDSDKLRQTLFDCLTYKITFFNYPDFYELLTGKVPVESIGPNWFLENLQEGQKNYFHFVKRLLDVLFALIILVISLPVWPFLAIIIKLASRGPVFFRQIRLGYNGASFKILKFRTMRSTDNDQAPTEVDDGRITAFGSFLRKTRLDELPQVINIIKGEMSFIGPRPERPEIATELEKKIPFYRTRLLIKPGLTGWDQISGEYHSPSLADSLEKLQSDLYYLKHRSLYLDTAIALKTIATMFSRSGR